ncbi:hypothetical protein [Romboutsia sp. 1001713B170131_170501_G6]|uniref:hypothetical protein n=1 Tax=Romboutsia sp. 1001713B170131_170501_G6 TaxID=2787108 RepID=UPI0018AC0335|nr:hypothetical protein [Romboutsia sp. 1001713B170131_170501_G6]
MDKLLCSFKSVINCDNFSTCSNCMFNKHFMHHSNMSVFNIDALSFDKSLVNDTNSLTNFLSKFISALDENYNGMEISEIHFKKNNREKNHYELKVVSYPLNPKGYINKS